MCIRFEIYLLQYYILCVLKKIYFETYTYKTKFIFESFYIFYKLREGGSDLVYIKIYIHLYTYLSI